MDLVSILLSLGGFFLSVYAIYTAKKVKDAVDETIRKANIQRDIPEIGDILSKLKKAKYAASVWIPGAVEKAQIGRDHLVDLEVIRAAEDSLAIWSPVDMKQPDIDRLEIERRNLRRYCEKIADPENNENHWNGVVVSTQSLIRLLRKHSRDLENSQLTPKN